MAEEFYLSLTQHFKRAVINSRPLSSEELDRIANEDRESAYANRVISPCNNPLYYRSASSSSLAVTPLSHLNPYDESGEQWQEHHNQINNIIANFVQNKLKAEGCMSKDQVERTLYEYARIRDKTVMAEIMGKILYGNVRNVAVMNNGSPYVAERKYTIHYVTDQEKEQLSYYNNNSNRVE